MYEVANLKEDSDKQLEIGIAKLEEAEGVYDVQLQTWIDTYPNVELGITGDDTRCRIKV